MKYLMCVLIIIGMTISLSCLAVSMIYGEVIFSLIFIVFLCLLAKEMQIETNRLQDY